MLSKYGLRLGTAVFCSTVCSFVVVVVVASVADVIVAIIPDIMMQEIRDGASERERPPMR